MILGVFTRVLLRCPKHRAGTRQMRSKGCGACHVSKYGVLQTWQNFSSLLHTSLTPCNGMFFFYFHSILNYSTMNIELVSISRLSGKIQSWGLDAHRVQLYITRNNPNYNRIQLILFVRSHHHLSLNLIFFLDKPKFDNTSIKVPWNDEKILNELAFEGNLRFV